MHLCSDVTASVQTQHADEHQCTPTLCPLRHCPDAFLCGTIMLFVEPANLHMEYCRPQQSSSRCLCLDLPLQVLCLPKHMGNPQPTLQLVLGFIWLRCRGLPLALLCTAQLCTARQHRQPCMLATRRHIAMCSDGSPSTSGSTVCHLMIVYHTETSTCGHSVPTLPSRHCINDVLLT